MNRLYTSDGSLTIGKCQIPYEENDEEREKTAGTGQNYNGLGIYRIGIKTIPNVDR